ncbi:hypothetical protein D7X94_09925 [Acutalibacter sp. 1XD8-33]|uniref:hypothetical protein n=1 Tax=Acutalibacter sp. 1XD8-33 TaxID=2320081 RepID=UPI000EA02E63|nr:hypothetical protein [Acutalibacter sp. 1XD8-33]RKJ39940.1 hypothetical protein D7X94_09925 [Acutalibacter sp. 1XD8-33]
MKDAKKLALCGVIAAMSVVLMLFEGLFSLASVAVPALAGCLLIPIVAEAGLGYAFGTFGATGLLCLFLAPDREAALIYLLFFGYYPALYAVLSKIKGAVLRWAAKLALFNAAAVSEALLTIWVLGAPAEEFMEIPFVGAYGPAVLLLLANGVFVVYDIALAGVIAQYYRRFRRMIAKYLQK